MGDKVWTDEEKENFCNNKIKRMDFRTGLEVAPINLVAKTYVETLKMASFAQWGEDFCGYKTIEILNYVGECIDGRKGEK